MSAADKQKLDGIAAGAQVNTVTGVKGGAESGYRTGNVEITAGNVGALPLSGGTMTGLIKFKIGSYTSTPLDIRAGDENGNGLLIGSGGLSIFGSGESPSSLYTALAVDAGSENTYISSGNSVYIVTGCQTIANRKTVTIDTAGAVTAAKFIGPLQGNASTATSATSATTATKLATARNIRTNLGSTSAASFDGSKDITPGVTGTLPIANGGTGATTAAGALSAIGAAAANHTHSNYLPLTGGTVTGDLTVNGVINTNKELRCTPQKAANAGTAGYLKVARITIKEAYVNKPINIRLSRRGQKYHSMLHLAFSNSATTDPTLSTFNYAYHNCEAYVYKAAESTWDLYIHKSESYDSIDFENIFAPNMPSGIAIAWSDEFVATLPAGYVAATPASYAHNVTGTSSNVTGTVTIAHGGTGATTASAALTALGAATKDHTHNSIKDAYNSATTTFAYSQPGLDSTSWFAAWNNYELRAISPAKVLSTIGAAAANHTHSYAGSATAGGAANSVKGALTIKFNGATKVTYDGSSASTIDITPAAIGAAAAGSGGGGTGGGSLLFKSCTVKETTDSSIITNTRKFEISRESSISSNLYMLVFSAGKQLARLVPIIFTDDLLSQVKVYINDDVHFSYSLTSTKINISLTSPVTTDSNQVLLGLAYVIYVG